MLTYTFSRREKALLVGLAVILIIVAWYFLVFQSTTNRIQQLDGEISEVQTSITTENARVKRLNKMEKAVEEYKAANAKKSVIPAYDNFESLMAELNGIMGATDTYTITFGELDRESSEYILRPAKIDYSCNSYRDAEAVVDALAHGTFPCKIDSVVITDGSSRSSRVNSASTGAYSATLQVTFFEKPPAGTSAKNKTGASSASASSASATSAASANSASKSAASTAR